MNEEGSGQAVLVTTRQKHLGRQCIQCPRKRRHVRNISQMTGQFASRRYTSCPRRLRCRFLCITLRVSHVQLGYIERVDCWVSWRFDMEIIVTCQAVFVFVDDGVAVAGLPTDDDIIGSA